MNQVSVRSLEVEGVSVCSLEVEVKVIRKNEKRKRKIEKKGNIRKREKTRIE